MPGKQNQNNLKILFQAARIVSRRSQNAFLRANKKMQTQSHFGSEKTFLQIWLHKEGQHSCKEALFLYIVVQVLGLKLHGGGRAVCVR